MGFDDKVAESNSNRMDYHAITSDRQLIGVTKTEK